MKTLTVIVPCCNEENIIEVSYSRIKAVLDTMGRAHTILFVNDGSEDRTKDILYSIAGQDDCVEVITLSRNFGQQAAITAGIHHCNTDLAFIIDADMQDPPEHFPEMLQRLEEEEANVVYGVRKKREGESRFKLWSSKHFYRTMNRMSEMKFPLDSGDFKLIDRRVMDEFNRFRERGKYVRGLISWVGFKQVPYFYERKARIDGETKYSKRKMFSFGSNALLYFSKKPLQIAVALGFLAVVVGMLMGIWSIAGKLFGYTDAESGWTSIMITVIFFGGVQLLTIGVLGQYIGIIFDEVKERPEYIIEEIKKGTD